MFGSKLLIFSCWPVWRILFMKTKLSSWSFPPCVLSYQSHIMFPTRKILFICLLTTCWARSNFVTHHGLLYLRPWLEVLCSDENPCSLNIVWQQYSKKEREREREMACQRSMTQKERDREEKMACQISMTQ